LGWVMPFLAVLARYIITAHPQLYQYLHETQFTWNGITQPNRLPLLSAGVGVDGLKTGHTEEAGYSMVGSAVQGSRRIIFVFSGLNSPAERSEEAERIVSWAFRQFVERQVVPQGHAIAEAEVWMGAAPSVPLIAAQDISVLVPVMAQSGITAHVEYDGPLAAPVAAGQEVAALVVDVPGMEPRRVPLVAGADVAQGGFMPRIRTAAAVLGERLGLGQP